MSQTRSWGPWPVSMGFKVRIVDVDPNPINPLSRTHIGEIAQVQGMGSMTRGRTPDERCWAVLDLFSETFGRVTIHAGDACLEVIR